MSAAREAARRAEDDRTRGGEAYARRAGPSVRSEPDTQRGISRKWFNEGDPQGPTLREFREADAQAPRTGPRLQ